MLLESGADRLAERFERLAVPRLLEQQRRQLELEAGVVDVAPLHARNPPRDTPPRPTPSEVDKDINPYPRRGRSPRGRGPWPERTYLGAILAENRAGYF